MKRFFFILLSLFTISGTGTAQLWDFSFAADSCILVVKDGADTLQSYDLESLTYGSSSPYAFYMTDASGASHASAIWNWSPEFDTIQQIFNYLDSCINVCNTTLAGSDDQLLTLDSSLTSFYLGIEDGNSVTISKGGGGFQVWDTLQSGSDAIYASALPGAATEKDIWLSSDTTNGLRFNITASDFMYLKDGTANRAYISTSGIASYGSFGFLASGTNTDIYNTNNDLIFDFAPTATDSVKWINSTNEIPFYMDDNGYTTINTLGNFTWSDVSPFNILTNEDFPITIGNSDVGRSYIEFQQTSAPVAYIGVQGSFGDLHLAKTSTGTDGLGISANAVQIREGFRLDGDIDSNAGGYTVAANYCVVRKTGITGGGDTVTLPATPVSGSVVYVKDATGGAATDNITISGNGRNIDGAANYVINTNYGGVMLHYDGSNWFILSKF